MKRINQVTVAAVMALCIVGTLRVASGDSQDQDNARPSTVIRLVERAHDVTFPDTGTPGPSLGDRLVFTSDLFFEDGQPAGRDGADGVIVRIDPSAPPAEQQVVRQADLQRAVFCRRRCSLAFLISLISPAGRISQMVPYCRAGCCDMSCTA